ncbi:MAG: YggS family pyridoxal phosphate-dependent enzyme, partial [Rhodospirillaceae bacterium]|nr:YggS family pyridoxal phosphate-dependent enzyme [Rhodospirillaceae bacterium]
MTVAENLANLNAAISEACRRAGRASSDVTLIPVS